MYGFVNNMQGDNSYNQNSNFKLYVKKAKYIKIYSLIIFELSKMFNLI